MNAEAAARFDAEERAEDARADACLQERFYAQEARLDAEEARRRMSPAQRAHLDAEELRARRERLEAASLEDAADSNRRRAARCAYYGNVKR